MKGSGPLPQRRELPISPHGLASKHDRQRTASRTASRSRSGAAASSGSGVADLPAAGECQRPSPVGGTGPVRSLDPRQGAGSQHEQRGLPLDQLPGAIREGSSCEVGGVVAFFALLRVRHPGRLGAVGGENRLHDSIQALDGIDAPDAVRPANGQHGPRGRLVAGSGACLRNLLAGWCRRHRAPSLAACVTSTCATLICPLLLATALHAAAAEPIAAANSCQAGTASCEIRTGPRRSTAPFSTEAERCIIPAATVHQVNEHVLRAILKIESNLNPRAVGKNTNGSIDVGIAQINSIHFRELSKFGVKPEHLLDACVGTYVAAWLLRSVIARHGNTWEGIAHYHSGTPYFNRRYQILLANELIRAKVLEGTVQPVPQLQATTPLRQRPPRLSTSQDGIFANMESGTP